jgi:hypothetical protein
MPYTPKEVDMRLRKEFSPRALLMLALVVCVFCSHCSTMFEYMLSDDMDV